MDVDSLVELKPNPRIPAFRVGDTVRVYAKVVEGDRERIQAFEGVVIRIRRSGLSSNFTARRISHGVGIERIFPYYSPLIEKVEVVRVGRVRRARLYYLRERVGKAARLKAGSRDRFEALTARPYAEEEEAAEEEPEEEEAPAAEEAPPEEEEAAPAEEAAPEDAPAAAEAEAAAEAPPAQASADEPAAEAGEPAAEPEGEAPPEAEGPAAGPEAEAKEEETPA